MRTYQIRLIVATLSATMAAGCGALDVNGPEGGRPETARPPAPANVAWGEVVDGLRVGLGRPSGPFRVAEPMILPIFVQNLSDEAKAVQLMRCDPVGHDFEVTIRHQDGYLVPTRGECLKKHVIDRTFIATEGVLRLEMDLLNQWCIGVRELSPGKYAVTVSYEHAAGHWQSTTCPYWHGKITTGPVEIEIRPNGATAALSQAEIVKLARELGEKRWPEQVHGGWPAGKRPEVLDVVPVVNRTGANWTVVFQLGAPERSGSRITVVLDVTGQEVSTLCEWSPI